MAEQLREADTQIDAEKSDGGTSGAVEIWAKEGGRGEREVGDKERQKRTVVLGQTWTLARGMHWMIHGRGPSAALDNAGR